MAVTDHARSGAALLRCENCGRDLTGYGRFALFILLSLLFVLGFILNAVQ